MTALNKAGESALKIAAEHGHKEIATFLSSVTNQPLPNLSDEKMKLVYFKKPEKPPNPDEENEYLAAKNLVQEEP